jgi:hypothetical protein
MVEAGDELAEVVSGGESGCECDMCFGELRERERTWSLLPTDAL